LGKRFNQNKVHGRTRPRCVTGWALEFGISAEVGVTGLVQALAWVILEATLKTSTSVQLAFHLIVGYPLISALG
jgi:hypothetical protein